MSSAVLLSQPVVIDNGTAILKAGFAGGDRPFIESVTDAAPLLYLVHNAIMDSEIEAAKAKLAPYLLPHPPGRSSEAPIHRATRSLGALRGAQLTAFYDRVASIVGYPGDHLSEPILERRRAGQSSRSA